MAATRATRRAAMVAIAEGYSAEGRPMSARCRLGFLLDLDEVELGPRAVRTAELGEHRILRGVLARRPGDPLVHVPALLALLGNGHVVPPIVGIQRVHHPRSAPSKATAPGHAVLQPPSTVRSVPLRPMPPPV